MAYDEDVLFYEPEFFLYDECDKEYVRLVVLLNKTNKLYRILLMYGDYHVTRHFSEARLRDEQFMRLSCRNLVEMLLANENGC